MIVVSIIESKEYQREWDTLRDKIPMMKIKFKEYYTATTCYFGIVNDKHRFYITEKYVSTKGTYKIKEVVWLKKKPKRFMKAEKRIKVMVQKFHEREDNENNTLG